jgi:hypothetical protein
MVSRERKHAAENLRPDAVDMTGNDNGRDRGTGKISWIVPRDPRTPPSCGCHSTE